MSESQTHCNTNVNVRKRNAKVQTSPINLPLPSGEAKGANALGKSTQDLSPDVDQKKIGTARSVQSPRGGVPQRKKKVRKSRSVGLGQAKG